MNNRRRSLLAFLAVLGVVAGGTYTAVDVVGPSPSSGDHVLVSHSLTWWPNCSRPPTHPNGEAANIQADIDAGRPVSGYFLVAPPLSFGLPNTPDGQAEAGKRSADLAREGLSAEQWQKLAFVALDVEKPSVCGGYEIPIATIQAAVDEIRNLGKCLGNITDPCDGVLYTSVNEWTNNVVPANPPHPAGVWLWNASWTNQAEANTFPQHPFGGWTSEDILLTQFAGNTTYNGASVDLDSIVVDPAVFQTEPAPPAPTATPAPVVEGQPVNTPSYAPGCWGPFDSSWGGRWNDCVQGYSGAWVGPEGNFLVTDLGQWFYANGMPLQ